MKTLMVVAGLLLVVGVVKSDVILGGLAVSALLFAGASVLGARAHAQRPANV